MFPRRLAAPLAGLLCLGALAAQHRPALFDRVVTTLVDGFYDRDFALRALPGLTAVYRPAAVAAADAAEERAVVHAMLGKVGCSHLALLSAATWQRFEHELAGEDAPTLGMQLLEIGGRFFVDGVLDGGPAERAGIRRGDRVLTIDDRAPGRSPRLDWRADDAALPDLPVHELLATAGLKVELLVESEPGQVREVAVTAASYSALRASKASVSVVEHDGRRYGYVHLWYVFEDRSVPLLREALQQLRDCDGVVVDLRGRGGSANECAGLVALLQAVRQPLALLVDERTRSAKEMLAFDLQQRHVGLLVGEATAGALLPASFVDVGHGAVLMYPEFRLQHYSDWIEGVGVAPDLVVADRLPFANGKDPILQAAVEALAAAALTPR